MRARLNDAARSGIGQNTWPRRRNSRAGFTLIELLVVVAIIVVLIALILPSLGRARAQSRTTACGANLRGMGVTMSTYASDIGDYPTYYYETMPSQSPTPQSKDAFRSVHVGTSMWQWMLPALQRDGYLGSVKIGYCTEAGPVDATGHTSPTNYPAGMVWRLDGDYATVNGKNATNPYNIAQPYINQGDYLYFGPGVCRRAWDTMYTPAFSHTPPIVAAMYATGYKSTDWAGHAGGVHSTGLVRIAYSNATLSNANLGEHEDSGITAGARTPLMQDSILDAPVGSQWWAGPIIYGPHSIDSGYGYINAVFTDGSVEKLSVK